MKQELNHVAYYLKQKRYSDRTIRAYYSAIKGLFEHFSYKNPQYLTEDDLRDYMELLVEKRKASTSYQKIVISGIKLYFEEILGRELDDLLLIIPQGSKRLPTFLSKEEVKSIIDNIDNLKHKSIIALIYSCGLRIGEVVNLKIKDIDSKNMIVWIREGKGRKDRLVLLSIKILELFREYWKNYKPKDWLFEGQKGGQYSTESIQAIFKRSCQKARINKDVTVHTLRHSFATHLIEQGTNLKYVQKILGHKNIKTTEIYTHVTDIQIGKISSPIDDIDLK